MTCRTEMHAGHMHIACAERLSVGIAHEYEAYGLTSLVRHRATDNPTNAFQTKNTPKEKTT